MLQTAIVIHTPKRTVLMRRRTSQRSTMRTGWCWPIKGDIRRAREELSDSAQQKLCNTLDVRCLRKHVDGADPLERVSRVGELTRIGSERRGVAGDVDDPLRLGFDDAPYHLLRQPRSRGIDHQHIG